jgi:hypothetical protein
MEGIGRDIAHRMGGRIVNAISDAMRNGIGNAMRDAIPNPIGHRYPNFLMTDDCCLMTDALSRFRDVVCGGSNHSFHPSNGYLRGPTRALRAPHAPTGAPSWMEER